MASPMDQLTTTNAPDSTMLVTMTKGELRELIRNEIQAVIATTSGVTLNPEFSGRQKPYLTVREAADLARLATSTVRLYIRKRKLKAQKVGRRVIIARCELEAFLSQNPIDVRFQ